MKKIILAAICICSFQAMANQGEETADAICQKVAKEAIVEMEAKSTMTKKDQITLSEFKLIGSGTMLYLYSGFVDGPNTGDNTHWEVAASLDYQSNTCSVATSRRFWAH